MYWTTGILECCNLHSLSWLAAFFDSGVFISVPGFGQSWLRELFESPGLHLAGVDSLLFYPTSHNPVEVISTSLTPVPTTPPPVIGFIPTWKLQAHYHNLGLIRAPIPGPCISQRRWRNAARRGNGREKEISYRACHPSSQVLKIQIRLWEEITGGRK